MVCTKLSNFTEHHTEYIHIYIQAYQIYFLSVQIGMVSLDLSGEHGWLVSLDVSPGGEPGCELTSPGLLLAFWATRA